MEPYELHKEFYSDKSIDELQFNLTFYKSRLLLLEEELGFFKHLMNSKIYDARTPNLFETFELFKKRIDADIKLHSKFLIEIDKQYSEVELKLECDELSCDDYFIRQNYELELEVVNFLMQTAKLKSEMIEYLKALIP